MTSLCAECDQKVAAKGLCRNHYAKQQYKKTKAIHNARCRKAAVLRKYKITLEDAKQMVEQQANCCAICSNLFTIKNYPNIDHCHITGRVRGMLCTQCNKGLGCFTDNIEALQSAIEYLNKHKE